MQVGKYVFASKPLSRELGLAGKGRGISVAPQPTLATPVRVHANSHLTPLPVPGKGLVLEWTGDTHEIHVVDY